MILRADRAVVTVVEKRGRPARRIRLQRDSGMVCNESDVTYEEGPRGSTAPPLESDPSIVRTHQSARAGSATRRGSEERGAGGATSQRAAGTPAPNRSTATADGPANARGETADSAAMRSWPTARSRCRGPDAVVDRHLRLRVVDRGTAHGAAEAIPNSRAFGVGRKGGVRDPVPVGSADRRRRATALVGGRTRRGRPVSPSRRRWSNRR